VISYWIGLELRLHRLLCLARSVRMVGPSLFRRRPRPARIAIATGPSVVGVPTGLAGAVGEDGAM